MKTYFYKNCEIETRNQVVLNLKNRVENVIKDIIIPGVLEKVMSFDKRIWMANNFLMFFKNDVFL